MTSDQKLEMHQQHREADLEIESWLDDINMWRAEHKQAIAWLAQIEASVHENDARIQQHFGAVDKQQRHVRQHEHAIAVNEQSGKYKDQSLLDSEHESFNTNQVQSRESHAAIGKHHREKMATIMRLLKEFEGNDTGV